MKTRKKASGFFIVEVLIVLVLVALLTLLLLPNFTQYTDKAKFLDVVRTAEVLKPTVEACYLGQGGGSTVANCDSGSYGVPAAVATPYKNILSTNVDEGVITVTSGTTTSTLSTNGQNKSFILVPTVSTAAASAGGGTVSWTSSTASTCISAGVC